MTNQVTTQENLSKFIEFRQAVYAHAFTARRDALFELQDALVVQGPVDSFPMLSTSPLFRRQWHSAYAALEDGCVDSDWLRHFLAQQVPDEGICIFALDGSAWPRPRARTMEDRQYVYHPTAAVNGGSVFVGYPYSLLEWIPMANASWSLPVDVRRIPSTLTAQQAGIEQVRALAAARQDYEGALDIVATDAKYGTSSFFRQVKGLRCGVVSRLRRDRILYGVAPPCINPPQLGRPRVHGRRFVFKDPQTWGLPDEVVGLDDPYWGQVRLERWNGLHEKKSHDVPFDVVRACAHLERDKPPAPVWLAWQAPSSVPAGIALTTESVWRAYHHRWSVEAAIRFRKQRLNWTKPQFQSKEVGDRWTEVVALCMWLLHLARPLVQDCPLPWQKSQTHLTPQRVQQSMWPIFATIVSPAGAPKTRGKPPGWPAGKRRAPKQRHLAVKKKRSVRKAA